MKFLASQFRTYHFYRVLIHLCPYVEVLQIGIFLFLHLFLLTGKPLPIYNVVLCDGIWLDWLLQLRVLIIELLRLLVKLLLLRIHLLHLRLLLLLV